MVYHPSIKGKTNEYKKLDLYVFKWEKDGGG